MKMTPTSYIDLTTSTGILTESEYGRPITIRKCQKECSQIQESQIAALFLQEKTVAYFCALSCRENKATENQVSPTNQNPETGFVTVLKSSFPVTSARLWKNQLKPWETRPLPCQPTSL